MGGAGGGGGLSGGDKKKELGVKLRETYKMAGQKEGTTNWLRLQNGSVKGSVRSNVEGKRGRNDERLE